MSASRSQRQESHDIAMQDAKGKPRVEGYPVSQRSAEFKEGASWMKSFAPDGLSNAYEAGRNNLVSMNARYLAVKTR